MPTIALPVYNLEISKELGGEFQIERVQFVSSDKIPRIRKRLKIPYRIKDLRKKHSMPVFTKAKSYAFLRFSRSKTPDFTFEYNLLREAIWLLRSSQFSREPRTNEDAIGLPGSELRIVDEGYLIERKRKKITMYQHFATPFIPYTLDNAWKIYVSHHFFPYLVMILNNKITVKSQWRKCLRKAAILAAKSHYSFELSQAFLYNMIAIETLLGTGERSEKFSRALYDRLDAFFGWIHDPEKLKAKVDRIYGLRCKFVHQGQYEDIKINDVFDTDELLGNLLYNICKCIKLFSEKKKIVEFATQIEARKILGQKIRRPKGLRYRSKNKLRRKKEIDQLKKIKKW